MTQRKDFYERTQAQQAAWLKRETRKVRLMHIAGWTLIGGAGLIGLLTVFKTFVLYGPIRALDLCLVLSGVAILPWVCARVLHIVMEHRVMTERMRWWRAEARRIAGVLMLLVLVIHGVPLVLALLTV